MPWGRSCCDVFLCAAEVAQRIPNGISFTILRRQASQNWGRQMDGKLRASHSKFLSGSLEHQQCGSWNWWPYMAILEVFHEFQGWRHINWCNLYRFKDGFLNFRINFPESYGHNPQMAFAHSQHVPPVFFIPQNNIRRREPHRNDQRCSTSCITVSDCTRGAPHCQDILQAPNSMSSTWMEELPLGRFHGSTSSSLCRSFARTKCYWVIQIGVIHTVNICK